MTQRPDLGCLANLLVVELADRGITMAYSYARTSLQERVDDLSTMLGIDGSSVVADYLTEGAVRLFAESLAQQFTAYEADANERSPGVMFGPTACLQIVEILGWGISELLGMDRPEGAAAAGEMVAVIANGLQEVATVHLSGAGCARLVSALDHIARATEPQHTANAGMIHEHAARAREHITAAVDGTGDAAGVVELLSVR